MHESLLIDLFILLASALLGAELLVRMGQPAIIGQLLAGVVVGPAVFDFVHTSAPIELFAELGVIFLLFHIGLEMRLSDLLAVGPVAIRVGTLGFVVPLAVGIGLAYALGMSGSQALFIGASLVATSVGITAAVLRALRAHATPASRVILGAAIVDDVLAMLLLAVVVATTQGALDPVDLAGIIVLALGFVGLIAYAGSRIMRSAPQMLLAPRFSESPLMPAVMVCLGLAVLSELIGLAAIIGAFLAGMVIAETRDQATLEREVEPFTELFAPVFFASIGLQVDVGELADPTALWVLGIVTLAAIASKYAAARIGARSMGTRSARIVGVGMVPRGEVGVIVAGIGASSGVFDERLFAIVVGMSVLTTIVTPVALRRLIDSELPEVESELREAP